jgi:hypothetical protein
MDFSNRSDLFDALQKNTHIVAQYFDLRTQSYYKNVMSPAFGVQGYGTLACTLAWSLLEI